MRIAFDNNSIQKTVLIVPALLLVALTMPGCCTMACFKTGGPAAEEARRWEEGSREARSHGRMDKAEDYLMRAIEKTPRDSRLREQLAEIHISRGEYSQAIQELSLAIEYSGGDPELHVQLGEVYLRNGNWLPAARQAELALAGNRQLSSAWMLQGKIQLAKGNHSEALSYLQRAMSLSPGDPEVQLATARLHHQLSQPMRALSCLEQFLSKYPVGQQPPEALLLEGEVLIDLEQYQPAIEKLQLAASAESVSETVLIQLARAQFLAGQPSEARLTLANAARRFPDRPQILELLEQMQSGGQERFAALERNNR